MQLPVTQNQDTGKMIFSIADGEGGVSARSRIVETKVAPVITKSIESVHCNRFDSQNALRRSEESAASSSSLEIVALKIR